MPAVGEGFDIAVTGSTHDEYGIRFTADPKVHGRLVERLNNKIQNHTEKIADIESYNVEAALLPWLRRLHGDGCFFESGLRVGL